MRRALEVLLLISTTVILIATSRAPVDCATETVVLRAHTTCGPDSDVTLTSNRSCSLTATGDGFPAAGNVNGFRPDAGVMEGFFLSGPREDGGVSYGCNAGPEDGGLFITCSAQGPCSADGGADAGPCECSGLLTLP